MSADERLRRLLLGAFVLGLAVSITLSEVALAALAVRFVYRVATGRARTAGWPLGLPLAAWTAVSVVAALGSGRPLESLVAAKGLLLVATFYVVLDALDAAAGADRFLDALLALLGLVAVVGMLQVALCPWMASAPPPVARFVGKCHRAHGFYSIYMTFAGVLSLVLLATLPRLLPGAGGAALWRAGAWLAGAVGLALTYVRGAWVGFAAGVAVLLGLVRRGRGLVAAGAVLLIAAVLLIPGVLRRAESIVDLNDPTARERVLMWRSGFAMVRAHPVLGTGPGGVKREYPRYASPHALQQRRGHLHNTPLQVLVERGALGLAAWAWVFGAFFHRAGRVLRGLPVHAGRERRLVAGSVAAIAAFLVGGLTEYNFGDAEVALVAWAVMAVPFVVKRDLME